VLMVFAQKGNHFERTLLRAARQFRWGLAARLDLQAVPVDEKFPLFSMRPSFTVTGHRDVPPV
jgi:hypothetical protein